MTNTRVSQVSFARGELCPPLYMRTDIEQYSIGLKCLKNGFVHQEGCVSNRAGLEYVGEAKYSNKKTRLIPFIFNSEQTYIIEAGDKYFRFIQDGGYIIVENADAWVSANEYSAGDYVTENDKTYFCLENHTSTTFSDDLEAEKWREQDIYEIITPYDADDLYQIKYVQSADVLTLTHMNYTPKELSRLDHDNWQLEDIILQPSISAPTNVTVTWTGSTSSNTRTYTYLVTAVDKETLEESERSATVTATGHREAYWTTSEYFTISWSAVENAVEYNIYRSVNGIFGYVGTASNTSFVDDNIEPDMKETAPILKNPFDDGNNPSCCAYYQQRKIYGNTLNNPQTIYASQSATSNNFNHSMPLIASDSVELPLADREVNEIRHLIPFKDLIALTSNSEYKINGADGKFEANPMPVATVQSSYGASHVQPVVSGSMVIFVEAGGAVIRELGYDYLSDSYDGDELSLFASHLFEGKEVIYIAYSKAPYRIVYVIFNDGTCATLTYNKKQKLCGWGRTVTEGKFESVAVVREGKEDIAYFVIQRTINNQTVRYIERNKTRIIKDAKKAFLVDCGLSAHFNTPVTSISGLNHLKNANVIVLADGGVITGLKVGADGTLALPKETTDLVVGLPYEFELETLGVEGDNTHGLLKQINSITINVLNSREDFFIVGNTGEEMQLARSIDSVNNTGYLYSGKKDATVLNTPSENATVHIKQKYPLPLTIAAISAIVNIADISDNNQ